MTHWVLYFGREHTQERYKKALHEGFAAVGQGAHESLRKLRRGDKLLFYAAMSGFVARGKADAAVRRSGVPGVRFVGAEEFRESVRYRFPESGLHPELGIGYEDLPRELLPIHETAYLRVLAKVGNLATPKSQTAGRTPIATSRSAAKTNTPNGDSPVGRPVPNRIPERPPPGSAVRGTGAGGYAMKEYEKRAGRWSMGKAAAETFGLGFVARYADARMQTGLGEQGHARRPPSATSWNALSG